MKSTAGFFCAGRHSFVGIRLLKATKKGKLGIPPNDNVGHSLFVFEPGLRSERASHGHRRDHSRVDRFRILGTRARVCFLFSGTCCFLRLAAFFPEPS